MTTGHVFIAQSLDGFIARPDGSLDWLLSRGDPAEDHGYGAFIAGVDAIVMGRGTFETVLAFDPWPYALPVFVMSASLPADAVPAHLSDHVRILGTAPQAVMAQLEADGISRVYVDGGRVVQSFLAAGLIADMVITTVPVLLGTGRPLFGALARDAALVHETTAAFPSGMVQSRYRVVAG